MVAARSKRTLVGTVSTYANQLFPRLWQQGLFPELAGTQFGSEVALGRSRFDFRVDDIYVEVKSVTYRQGRRGLFPDAVTARGARHCRELAGLVRGGTPAAIVFVAQRGDVDAVCPAAEIDPEFAAALEEAASAGVQVLACGVQMTVFGARRARRLPVRLETPPGKR
jgi:sugar fermentation stimulation protein A